MEIRARAAIEARHVTPDDRTAFQSAIGIATINKTLTTLGTVLRNIDVNSSLLVELNNWRLRLGKGEPDDLVFRSAPGGGPLHRSTLYKQDFLPAIRKSGVPRVRFHDLCHTYASLPIDPGEHPKYLQAQMRHSSINVTRDFYAHPMNKVNMASANRLAKTVFGEDTGDSSSKSVAK